MKLPQTTAGTYYSGPRTSSEASTTSAGAYARVGCIAALVVFALSYDYYQIDYSAPSLLVVTNTAQAAKGTKVASPIVSGLASGARSRVPTTVGSRLVEHRLAGLPANPHQIQALSKLEAVPEDKVDVIERARAQARETNSDIPMVLLVATALAMLVTNSFSRTVQKSRLAMAAVSKDEPSNNTDAGPFAQWIAEGPSSPWKPIADSAQGPFSVWKPPQDREENFAPTSFYFDDGGNLILMTSENANIMQKSDQLVDIEHPVESLVQTGRVIAVLVAFFSFDRYLLKVFVANNIPLPSSLGGMAVVLVALLGIEKICGPSTAIQVRGWFKPGTDWLARWLSLFFVPSLVILPLAVAPLTLSQLGQLSVIIVGGLVSTMWFTGILGKWISTMMKIEIQPAPPAAKPIPFSKAELIGSGAAMVGAFGFIHLLPTGLSQFQHHKMAAVTTFTTAATLFGFLIGNRMPTKFKALVHPLITCAVVTNIALWLYGMYSGQGWNAMLTSYLNKGKGFMGGGDILMDFLGIVLVAFGFFIFDQRAVIKRHAAEIFGTTLISSVFSLFTTVGMGRLMGLDPALSVAASPRAVTAALAVGMVDSLGVPEQLPITLAVVVLTGLLASVVVVQILNWFKFEDPITQGLSTASAAAGMGTAALSARKPETLPYCALAYSIVGIFSSLLCCVPAVRAALFIVAGGTAPL